jgi:ribosomal protein S18 acetylase RimI-like enzyme
MVSENQIVPASLEKDAEDYARLFVISAPEYLPALYAGAHYKVKRNLFRRSGNVLGFEHTLFTEVGGKIAGMVVSYEWETNKKQGFKTGMLVLQSMGFKVLKQARHLQWAGNVLSRIDDGTYYVACLSFYEDYRNKGYGTQLLSHARELAVKSGAARLELDAETDNEAAIRFYKRFGMHEEGEPKGTTIDSRHFEFIRMSMDIR